MRRFLVISLALVGLLTLAGCKNNTPAPKNSGAPSTATGSTMSPVVAEDIPNGTYLYNSYGVHATIKPDGDDWTMVVKNNTGHGLGKPALYALDAQDGHQIKASLEGSEPLANGKEVTLTITWDLPTFEPTDIGLVILEFGDDNFGAFAYGA